MRQLRTDLGVTTVGAVVALLLVIGVGVNAKIQSTDVAAADHPLIGTWIVNSDAPDPTTPLVLVTFSADGTYIQVNSDGHAGLGVWRADGAETATMTALGTGLSPQTMPQAMTTVRAEIAIDPGNDLFTMVYTVQFVAPGDGASSGQLGPATAQGRRIGVEPLGTPDAPLEVLGTPEATHEPTGKRTGYIEDVRENDHPMVTHLCLTRIFRSGMLYPRTPPGGI